MGLRKLTVQVQVSRPATFPSQVTQRDGWPPMGVPRATGVLPANVRAAAARWLTPLAAAFASGPAGITTRAQGAEAANAAVDGATKGAGFVGGAVATDDDGASRDAIATAPLHKPRSS